MNPRELGDPYRHITLRYSLALILILALSTVSYLVVYTVSVHESLRFELETLSRRQVEQVQQIANLLHELEQGPDGEVARQLRRELQASLASFEETLAAFRETETEASTRWAPYFMARELSEETSQTLDLQQAYQTQAQAMVETADQEGRLSPSAVRHFAGGISAELRARLALLNRLYQRNFQEGMDLLLWWVTLSWLLTIGIVVTITLFIFHPLAHRVSQYTKRLISSKQELEQEIERHQQTQSELREIELKAELAFEGAELGYWLRNLKTERITGNNRLYSMIGLKPKTKEMSASEWEERIHPDDFDGFHTKLDRLLEGRIPFLEVEYRLRCQDGTYRWVLDRGKVTERSASGGPLYMAGSRLDIQKRKEIDAATQQARHEADRNEKARARFIANVSHEIRTPLNAVIGMTELLSETKLEPKQRSFVDRIQSSSQNLLTLINDILDYSKLDAEKFALRTHDFSLIECLEEAVDVIADRAFKKDLNLSHYVDPTIPSLISGDSIRLRQVLINLLSNAAKFTDQGEILVTCYLNPPPAAKKIDLQFRVQDTGVGIPEGRQAELFRPFHQVDDSATRRFQGTGLGLAITRKLVHMMGGSISVESTLGKGSSFEFNVVLETASSSSKASKPSPLPSFSRLPILVLESTPGTRRLTSTIAAEASLLPVTVANHGEGFEALLKDSGISIALLPASLHDTESIELATEIRTHANLRHVKLILQRPRSRPDRQKDQLLFDEIISKPLQREELYAACQRLLPGEATPEEVPPPRPPPHESEATDFGPLRIVVAEDDHMNQEVAQGYLERLNLAAEVVSDGESLLKTLRSSQVDLVFMDLQMPVMDGLTATREIRRSLSKSQQPWIIAMTANASAEDREVCLKAGMNDFLSKPIGAKNLEQAILRYRQRKKRHSAAKPSEETKPNQKGPRRKETPPKRNRKSAKGDSPVCLERLTYLRDSLGEEQAANLVKIFLDDSDELLHSLENAIEAKDASEVRHWAHRIKGSSANIGADQVKEAAQRLEDMSKNDDLSQANPLYQEITRCLERWRTAVKSFNDSKISSG